MGPGALAAGQSPGRAGLQPSTAYSLAPSFTTPLEHGIVQSRHYECCLSFLLAPVLFIALSRCPLQTSEPI